MRKRIQYAFNTDASTFWDEVYLHDEYTTRVYPEAMGWKKAEILEAKSSGHGVCNRRVRVFPQLEHFKMFSKFLGNSFSYVEEGQFEPRKQLWQFDIAPPSFKNQLSVSISIPPVHPMQQPHCNFDDSWTRLNPRLGPRCTTN